jgi:hypothetical protein
MSPDMVEKMCEICRDFTNCPPAACEFPEPYVPYVARPWSGLLIVGSSENLGPGGVGLAYKNLLSGMTPEQRITRLGPPSLVSGRPWDNPAVKLGLVAVWPDIDLSVLSYSNAIPWTSTTGGSDDNLTDEMKTTATRFWRLLLGTMKPQIKQIILLGKMAKSVIDAAATPASIRIPTLNVRHPAARGLPGASTLFDGEDSLRRYPEVACAAKRLRTTASAKEILFACHMVSQAVSQRSNW